MGRKTRSVPKANYRNYIRKSDEFHRSARQAFERGDWNAAVSHAVHAALCMSDAVTVFYSGTRSAGEGHKEILRLFTALRIDRTDLDRNLAHLRALLQLKTTSEYEDRLLGEEDADASLRHADRFRQWALAKLAASG
ncbi:MAG TPA: HEPN domain-containing protein [Thermoplasmata archaeon]|nr:HEPN domain-containing protein [Thermoplasmata archaeon]